MKKISFYLMMMVLSLSILPSTSIAAETSTAKTINTKEMPAEVRAMFSRLEEIKAMDKSSMSRSEKKELRKEVRSIKEQLRTTGNGVYFSVGAIIIIILLLILIL